MKMFDPQLFEGEWSEVRLFKAELLDGRESEGSTVQRGEVRHKHHKTLDKSEL